jgi:hypothetical protein
VVDAVLDFVESSIAPNQFTIAPINEPCDNITNFGSPNTGKYNSHYFPSDIRRCLQVANIQLVSIPFSTVSEPNGVDYVNRYIKAVYAKMQARLPNVWLMQNDSFMGPSFWSRFWNTTDKWVIDSVCPISPAFSTAVEEN